MKGRLGAYVRFLLSLRRFLNQPLSFEEAKAIVAQRMQQREQNFLRLIKQCVYDNPSSPYLPLLKQAQCSYGDIVSGIRRWGLEGLLGRLKDAGVWASFDEFKGRKVLSRGGVEYRFPNSDFDNRFASSVLKVSTGGTSGQSSRTHLDLDFLAARACYDHLMFRMLDIYDVPLALWYPKLPASTGISNSLRYAKIGHPAHCWFHMLTDNCARQGSESWLATTVLVWASRLSARPLARPVLVRLDQVGTIVDWIVERRKQHGRCVVQTYVSQAVRISQTAAARGTDLRGVQFIVGSEPLTEAKHREITSAGAAVFPRYMATEIGTIGIGCGDPSEVGDYHLALDTIAVIQRDGESGCGPFYFTTLLHTTPKVMINVQLGDAGTMESRACGCLLGDMGLHAHLLGVRSIERATGEGMTLGVRELTRIIEKVLVTKYGGSSVDYQWIEEEDERSLTRLWLRVAPRVGPANETEIANDVLAELQRGDREGRLVAEMWCQARTIRVIRECPHPTLQGKIVPVLRERGGSRSTAGVT